MVKNYSLGWISPEIHAKHLIWNCQIHSLTNDFPVRTCTLYLALLYPESQKKWKSIPYEGIDHTTHREGQQKLTAYMILDIKEQGTVRYEVRKDGGSRESVCVCVRSPNIV